MAVQVDGHLWSLIRTQEGWLAGLWSTVRTRAYSIFDDEALVSRTRSGDFAAFDALVARYQDRLYAMAFASLGNSVEATAALCDAARSAFRDIDSAGPRCSPGVWLHLHGFRAVFQRLNVPPGRYSMTREDVTRPIGETPTIPLARELVRASYPARRPGRGDAWRRDSSVRRPAPRETGR